MATLVSFINPRYAELEKTLVDRYRTKGFAVLIVDSYTPRHAEQGVCDRGSDPGWYHARTQDAYAAWSVLAAMPEIDAKRIFVQAYSNGAAAALMAVDPINAPKGEVKFAGVIAYYPSCYYASSFSAPTLIMVGDKSDETALCRQQAGASRRATIETPRISSPPSASPPQSASGYESGP